MRALIIVNSINNCTSPLYISPKYFPFQSPSLSRESHTVFHSISRATWNRNPRQSSLPFITASSPAGSAGYGGWDDFKLCGNPSSESTHFRNFLFSIGIDDKKHVFTFILGLFCALAVSRVRVSSIVVFPASILVFAVGFSFGFVRGGYINASNRRLKDEMYRVSSEKLKSLVDFFNEFDDKVRTLKDDIQRAIDRNVVTVSDLENYHNVMESIKLSASNARDDVEAYFVNVESSNNLLLENNKVYKKGKDIGEFGFDLLRFVGGFSGRKVSSSKSNKVKDNVKQGRDERVVNEQGRAPKLGPSDEPKIIGSYKDSSNSSSSHDSIKSVLSQDRDRGIRMDMQGEKTRRMGTSAMGFVENEEFSYRKNKLHFMNNGMLHNRGPTNGNRTWESNNSMLDSVDLRVSWKHMKSGTSFIQEEMLSGSNENYRSSDYSDGESYISRFREKKVDTESDSSSGDYLSPEDRKSDYSSSSSSSFEDDVVFDRYVTDANDLLKQAKECIKSSLDQEHAEIMLYKSAELLSKATAMKPLSLLAVGQLGNTYLLHGELKLRFSRELRSLLSRSDTLSVEKKKRVLQGLNSELTSKDEIATALVNVCEECEELLVKAGRKYRFALAIDGSDVRALYNWGLALSFRAQLISDVGPEAAIDADKIFLAATEKFDAMMSKGNIYAPDALFRWGVILQQRSRLRPNNSKEKVKLLQQAVRLYEDALEMDSENPQLREALLSCVSELDYSRF